MAYQISATKLQTYHRCPQAYQFRYELGLKTNSFFGSAALGTALHQTLAQVYGGWHYQEPLPKIDWLLNCWQQHSTSLSPTQAEEGKQILETYYQNLICNLFFLSSDRLALALIVMIVVAIDSRS